MHDGPGVHGIFKKDVSEGKGEGQERAHWTFNNENLNGWSCVIKWTELCHSYLLGFLLLDKHTRINTRQSLRKRGIKFAQSIKHVFPLCCWNINRARASNLKATRRKCRKFSFFLLRKFCSGPFLLLWVFPLSERGDVRRQSSSFLPPDLFFGCAILKSSWDVINDC